MMWRLPNRHLGQTLKLAIKSVNMLPGATVEQHKYTQDKSWFSSAPSSNPPPPKKEPCSSSNTQSWEISEMHTFFWWYDIFAHPHYFSFFWWEPRHVFFNLKKKSLSLVIFQILFWCEQRHLFFMALLLTMYKDVKLKQHIFARTTYVTFWQLSAGRLPCLIQCY